MVLAALLLIVTACLGVLFPVLAMAQHDGAVPALQVSGHEDSPVLDDSPGVDDAPGPDDTPRLDESTAESESSNGEVTPVQELTAAVLFQLIAAEIAAQSGQFGSAVQTMLELARQTGDSRIARRATELALRERVYARSLAAAQMWRKLAPESTQAVLVLENLYLAGNRLEDAGKLLAQRLAVAPDEAERAQIWLNLRQVLLRLDKPQAALGLAERLAQAGSAAQGEDRTTFAVLLVQSGSPEAAGQIAEALKLAVRHSSRLELAQAALQIKRHDLALLPLERLIREADDRQVQSQALLLLAQLMRESERAEEGFQLLDASLAKDPKRVELLYDHAMAAERLNRLEVAEKSLRSLIELRPRHAHAYNALGYALADRNIRLDEAQQLIEKALELSPEDPHIIDSMGWVLYRRGNLQGALEYLQKAYRLQADAEIAVHLGEVLWKLGRRDEALELWRIARKSEPGNAVLRETLGRLDVSL
jgi:tetratricopeptide (TPR) repeat protein